jgi:hypothetical protein
MKVCEFLVGLYLEEGQKVKIEDCTSERTYVGTDPYYPEWTVEDYNYVMMLTVKRYYVSDFGLRILTEYDDRNRKQ